MIMNADVKLIIGSVIFMLFLTICIVIAVQAQHWYDKRERRRRALEILRRKAEIRRRKEEEAAGQGIIDQIEEYRHDFDGHHQAG
jgi:uncharacterized membrane protein